MTIECTTIAIVKSPFKQKFAIPRQPNLVAAAEGELVFQSGFDDPNCLRGLEQFSHVWIIFQFHATAAQGWSATVQPPRLGGKKRVGVFASRSPFRPNGLGMSVVRNLGSSHTNGQLVLRVGGLDLLDGTPVLDVKPYIPYADALAEAQGGFADSAPGSMLAVEFSPEAMHSLEHHADNYPRLQELICSVLQQDPRPAWRVKDVDDKRYGMTLYHFNIKWCFEQSAVRVITIETKPETSETAC